MNEYSSLVHFLIEWKEYVFLILFIGMIFEGDLLLFSSAFLASQDYLSVSILTIVIFSGVMFGDSLWYFCGHVLYQKFSFFRRLLDKIPPRYDRHILDRPFKTFLISKFTYNMHHPILLRAGTINLDFKSFFKNDFYATVVWFFVVGGLGYVSGSYFFIVKHYLKYAEIILFALVFILFLVEYFIISRKLKQSL